MPLLIIYVIYFFFSYTARHSVYNSAIVSIQIKLSKAFLTQHQVFQ